MNYKAMIKRPAMIIAISVICLTLVTIGASYALFFQVESNSNNQIVTAGELNVTYGSGSAAISANELMPMSDETALTSNTMTGTIYIENVGTLPAKYEVKIGDDITSFTSRNGYSASDELVPHQYLRVAAFLNGTQIIEPQALSDLETAADDNSMYSIYTSAINVRGTGNNTATLVLKIWLDENAPVSVVGKYVFLKMDVTSEVEPLLEGSFAEELIMNSIIDESVDLTDNSTTINNKIYRVPDDFGYSYVYRGNAEKNYVRFGSYSENVTVNGKTFTANTDMNWRIIRINGDGSIRLMYADNLGNARYNSSDLPGKKFVGYMYGSGDDPYSNDNDSNAKAILDEWYEKSLADDYSDYLVDSIFCNDREENSNNTEFVISSRNNNPSLICNQVNDKFTTNSLIGNGKLTYPIGLITQDEAYYAGLNGYIIANTNYNDRIMTMSPNTVYGAISSYYNGGTVFSDEVDGIIIPVINIRGDVTVTGSGTQADPYVVVTN